MPKRNRHLENQNLINKETMKVCPPPISIKRINPGSLLVSNSQKRMFGMRISFLERIPHLSITHRFQSFENMKCLEEICAHYGPLFYVLKNKGTEIVDFLSLLSFENLFLFGVLCFFVGILKERKEKRIEGESLKCMETFILKCISNLSR